MKMYGERSEPLYRQGHSLRPAAVIATLIVVTMAAFWNALGNGFVQFDDNNYILNNAIVQRGFTLEGVRWAMTTFHTGNWHPLTWLSHMLDVELFGVNPTGHHAMNLVVHVLNVLLLFWILLRQTGALWLSAIVSMLFAVHPLRVESVAWVSERKDVLSTMFALLAIGSYFRYVQKRSPANYLTVSICLTLSLLAKPMFVSLPFILLLLDFWPLRRWRRFASATHARAGATPIPATTTQLLLEKLPFAGLAAGSCVITFIAQQRGGTVATLHILPFADRVGNAVVSYVRYLGKAFWPTDLAVLYPYPLQWPAWQVIGSISILVVITVAVLLLARRMPYLLVGWLWFIISLAPVIGIVQVGVQSIADRYTYFPLIGLCIAVVWGMATLLRSRLAQQIAVGISAIIIIALAWQTARQTKVWRDTPTLFLHAIRVTDDNVIMTDFLAKTLLEDYPEEVPLMRLRRAALPVEIDAHIYVSLAESFLKRGDMDNAMACYEATLLSEPNHQHANNNLAWLLATHPRAEKRNGTRAVQLATRAAELTNRRDAGVLDTLAAAQAETGKFFEAIETAQQARSIATEAAQPDLVNIIDFHLTMFRASRPIRIAE